MEDFISSTNLLLSNDPNSEPTFQHRNAKGWPNLSLIKDQQLPAISTWKMLEGISLSDHNYIEIQLSVPIQSHTYLRLWCDNESVFRAITSPKSRISIIQEIQMSLRNNPNIEVCWVQAHIGIAVNEAEDELAKKVTKEGPKFENPAPKSHLKKLLQTASIQR
ncbi:hypothetical protein AVEN_20447-1 [Araneus ventricosus]|uniref:Uncharacterized protein n=1 Tax=Araneus ventricosus TaxID=182803 RepID=A0A4Y2TK89_ARAVE|nr:hypothetical protein AVEN_20447-1 [Araneus ventricosus]